MRKAEPQKMWCIKVCNEPRADVLLVDTLSWYRSDAQSKVTVYEPRDWSHAYRLGYRAVRVTVEEE